MDNSLLFLKVIFIYSLLALASSFSAPKNTLDFWRSSTLRKQEALTPCVIDYDLNVLNSGVVNFAPWLELHHVVMLSAKSEKAAGVFAVDFSPYNQTSPQVLLQLLSGKSVPAEVRVRWIPNSNKLNNLKELKKTWSCLGPAGDLERSELDAILNSSSPTLDTLKEDYESVIQLIARIKRKWNCRMNLYSHNCQHFSAFVERLVRKDEVCKVE